MLPEADHTTIKFLRSPRGFLAAVGSEWLNPSRKLSPMG